MLGKIKSRTIGAVNANGVSISSRPSDFCLNFYHYPRDFDGVVPVTRVYIGPHMAKALNILLERMVEEYEKSYGEIKLDADESKMDITRSGFHGKEKGKEKESGKEEKGAEYSDPAYK